MNEILPLILAVCLTAAAGVTTSVEQCAHGEDPVFCLLDDALMELVDGNKLISPENVNIYKDRGTTRDNVEKVDGMIDTSHNETIFNILESLAGLGDANDSSNSFYKVTTRLNHIISDLHDMIAFSKTHNTKLQEIENKISVLQNDQKTLLKDVSTMKKNLVGYRDCSEVPDVGDGVYSVHVPGDHVPKHVFCDQTTAGGGWLVFQRRMDGHVNFQRNWDDYAQGFGNLNAEFWLGNDLLSALTSHKKYKLRIDMRDFSGRSRYAEYDNFRVDNARNKYKLTVGGYRGNAGDGLTMHRGMYFSTAGRDFDTHDTANCAAVFKGAWWYQRCHSSNLNGLYLRGSHKSYADGINWHPWHGYNYSLKFTEMKIKPME